MSNIIEIVNDQPITTSLAIADGAVTPHKSVIQLIRQHSSDLEDFGRVAFQNSPFETAGGIQNREVAILNEQQSMLLLTYMRNNEIVRAFKKQLIKAFFEMRGELKNRAASPADLSRMDILKLAMQSEEDKLRLENEKTKLELRIEEDAPKVAFAKQVEISEDAISVAQAAKIIGTGQKRLFAFLRRTKWVTRLNEPYQAKIDAGYLDVKLKKWNHPNDGLQQSVTAMVTGKGMTKLQQSWEQSRAEASI